MSLNLPQIYKTDLPERFYKALLANNPPLILLTAPTGFGKTFMGSQLLARYVAEHPGSTATVLMPFRVSVKAMHQYLNAHFNRTKTFPCEPSLAVPGTGPYLFGYAMRDDRQVPSGAHCVLKTVGYWLEESLELFRQAAPRQRQIIMLDEAHDSSWQTDLAAKILRWYQQQPGVNLTLIISSATLNSNSLGLEQGLPYLSLSVDAVADVTVHYCPKTPTALRNSRLTDDFKKLLIQTVIEVNRRTPTGDLLVLLPGQEDILDMYERLNKTPPFNDVMVWTLYPLHSQLAREAIEQAIQPQKEFRKIILATNIVENAITIDGLVAVIDSGYRKNLYVDEYGVQQLLCEPTSKANLKQSCGRVGRQGVRGEAYLMMTAEEYQGRPDFSVGEVDRNPFYNQIIKLIAHQLPLVPILGIQHSTKISNNLAFLRSNAMIEAVISNEDRHDDDDDFSPEVLGQYRVTPLGETVARLPLSIRSGHFLVRVLETLSPNHHYLGCLIAAWADYSQSLFYRGLRQPSETPAAYAQRMKELKVLQKRFHYGDCLTTMLKLWALSWTETTNQSLRQWCLANGVYERAITEIQSRIRHVVKALGRLGRSIPAILTIHEWQQLVENLDTIAEPFLPVLGDAYQSWQFKRANNQYSNPQFQRTRCVIDKNLPNGLLSRPLPAPLQLMSEFNYPPRLLALRLWRANPYFLVLSNIIDLESAGERATRLERVVKEVFGAENTSDSEADSSETGVQRPAPRLDLSADGFSDSASSNSEEELSALCGVGI